jgi:hypothetical protein
MCDGGWGGRGNCGSVGCGTGGHQGVGWCDGGCVGSGGSVVGTGGRGAGADSVGAGGRGCSGRFPITPGRRTSRFTGRRFAGSPGAACAAAGSSLGVGAGGTITGPVGGKAMKGRALSGAPGPVTLPAPLGTPAPIATRIGRDAMVASMITTTASRRTGPENPGPRWRPAVQRWREYTAAAWRISPNFASAAERVGMPTFRLDALGIVEVTLWPPSPPLRIWTRWQCGRNLRPPAVSRPRGRRPHARPARQPTPGLGAARRSLPRQA